VAQDEAKALSATSPSAPSERRLLHSEHGGDWRRKSLFSRIMPIMLAAVASVSLIVGGIRIMNIMLVSVRERTREIGLRQAVGAKTRDILTQFLVEAVTLSIAGGCVGIFLGITAYIVISRLASWNTVVSMGAVLLACFFSGFVGISFGYYPTRKAAYLDPIEALPSE
jgi:putative ABC transport system permease protein